MPKRGSNPAVYTFDVRSTNIIDFPDMDGSHGSEDPPIDARGDDEILVKLVSTLDEAGSFDLEFTTFDDPDFTESDVDTEGISISVGSSTTQTESIWTDANGAYYAIKFTADATPSSGSLKAVFQTDVY